MSKAQNPLGQFSLPSAQPPAATVFKTPPTRASPVHPEGAVPTAAFSVMVTALGCCVSGHPAQLLVVLLSVYFSLDTSAFDLLLPMKGYP